MRPKSMFLKTPSAEQWHEFTAGELFQRAMDTALLEFMDLQMSSIGAVYDAQAASHRIKGARMFAKVLAELGTKPSLRMRKDDSDLDFGEGGGEEISQMIQKAMGTARMGMPGGE